MSLQALLCKPVPVSTTQFPIRQVQGVTSKVHHGAGLENDEYVRQIDGYLPTCEVAFIDEIFKANSAILNALLTLLNERLFDNGNQRLRVPLLCMVSFLSMPPDDYHRLPALSMNHL